MTSPWVQRIALPVALTALLVLALVSLSVGDLRLGLGQIWDGLCFNDELATTVLWKIRLPRLLVAMLIGAALSASGLVLQAYFRNSLASPGLLGVSSGAVAGAVVVIGAGLAGYSLMVVPTASVVGALVATFAVVILARRGASTERLLLAGVGLCGLAALLAGGWAVRRVLAEPPAARLRALSAV